MPVSPLVTGSEDEFGRPVLLGLPTGPIVLAAALGDGVAKNRGSYVAAVTTAGRFRDQDSIPQVEDSD